MIKVLVVDDNQDIAFTVKTVLEEKDNEIKVDSVNRGEDCLEYLANKHKPDIILLDIMMPGIGGMETAKRIKTDPKIANIPIIFLSAKTDKSSKEMSDHIAEGYVEKPFETEELYKTILAKLK